MDAPTSSTESLIEAQRRLVERQHPLRFVWRMDAKLRFDIEPGDFIALVGAPTAAVLGRSWEEVAETLRPDPDASVLRAVSSRETFSAIQLAWPAEGTSARLPVVLSGLPMLGRDRAFSGYRGFGVCRDPNAIAAVVAARQAMDALTASAPELPHHDVPLFACPDPQARDPAPPDPSFDMRAHLTIVPAAKNVVPLRAGIPPDTRPTLSAVEHGAFYQIAQALGARLEANAPLRVQPPQSLPAAEAKADARSAPCSDLAGRRERTLRPTLERAVIDRLPLAVIAYRHEHLLLANQTFLEWTGYANVEALSAVGGLGALFADVPCEPTNSSSAVALYTASRSTLPVDARLFTLGTDEGPTSILILSRSETDASAQAKAEANAREMQRALDAAKRHEEDLLNAKRNAEKASAAASSFVAAVSRKLRKPLQAAIDLADAVTEERYGPLNPRYQMRANDVRSTGERAICRLDDLLGLTNVAAGRLDLIFAPIDLNDLIQQCVSAMQPQANRGHVIIRTALAPMLPSITADVASVRKLVLNLLSDALARTRAGGQVILSTTSTQAGEAVIRMRDTGAGMSEAHISATAERLKLDSEVPSHDGLSLIKALAEANRATFTVRSAANLGTLVETIFPPAAQMLAEQGMPHA
jgi:signal transduction histidine kinase